MIDKKMQLSLLAFLEDGWVGIKGYFLLKIEFVFQFSEYLFRNLR